MVGDLACCPTAANAPEQLQGSVVDMSIANELALERQPMCSGAVTSGGGAVGRAMRERI